MPRLVEEAILVYVLRREGRDTQIGSINVSLITKEQFNDYNRILNVKYGNDFGLAQKELSEYFGNTLWYYLHYVSPITTKKEIKERDIE
jgi:hypothetical protein